MVVRYLPLAGVVANRYRRRGVDFDDLEQVARLGLIKSVRRWRPERGRFLAYAMPTIDGEVKRHFRDSGSTIRIPRVLYESQPRVAAAQRTLRQELGREPSSHEIAGRAGIAEHLVRDVRAATTSCQVLSTDDESLKGQPDTGAEHDLSTVAARTRLRPALGALSDRERRIVALRFIWGQSQLEIAGAVGVSQMQVSRVLRAALEKMRQRLAESPEAPA